MIGVAANAEDLCVAKEFFELFKTPWEPAVPTKKYAVVLSADGSIENLNADRFLVYHSSAQIVDREAGVAVEPVDGPIEVGWTTRAFPIYGRAALFATDAGILKRGDRTLDYCFSGVAGRVRRIGYDLFGEVRFLLTEGQPASWAATPTLDLHVELLRHLLLDLGVSFLEIPPRPDRYDFICCLTHDVDFFGIRRHTFDRTLTGFALRASLGTLLELFRARRPLSEAIQNWLALLALPLVFLRLLPDFWRPFEDYATVERGHKSTFFLVPFKDRASVGPDGAVTASRAVSYQISEIRGSVNEVTARGSELAVHGIDAWRDVDAGRAELSELTSVTGQSAVGVRMHWLYFARDSAKRLEEAGFAYDSTWGYNDAVGYLAGTSQVFRPIGSARLLELPLAIMDSAMFFPRRMALTRKQSLQRCHAIVADARRFGGTLVINWHDRSLAPERLWGWCYQELLAELEKGDRAWFATAGEAVDWFRWRRSIRFDSEVRGTTEISGAAPLDGLPAARVLVHRRSSAAADFADELRFDGETVLRLAL
jgi:hypothetical protein